MMTKSEAEAFGRAVKEAVDALGEDAGPEETKAFHEKNHPEIAEMWDREGMAGYLARINEAGTVLHRVIIGRPIQNADYHRKCREAGE